MVRRKSLIILFLAIFAAFFAVDCLSIHTGDDLGYMFADSQHHLADGERVTSLWQCITTQIQHYQTTNGRFLVHVVVMAMLNVVPLWLFRALNALMFTLLCVGVARLSGRLTAFRLSLSALLLFVFLPTPAMLLFTLVSYAVNYVWVGCAVVGFLLLLLSKKCGNYPVILCVTAFVTGTLQESFSLPLCAGFLVLTLMRRCPWWLFACLVAGTAVCVFAPGNWHHAAQGGGFTAAAVTAKSEALLRDLPLTIIPCGLALWGALALRQRKLTAINIFALTVMLSALLLACVTYTSPRQLTCPCIFAILTVLHAIPEPKRPGIYITTFCAVTACFLAIMVAFRIPILRRYNALLESVNDGAAVAYPHGYGPADDPSRVTYLNRSLRPDPLMNIGLVAIGDRYTISAFRRLHNPRLQTLLPYDPALLVSNEAKGTNEPNMANEPDGANKTNGSNEPDAFSAGTYTILVCPNKANEPNKANKPNVANVCAPPGAPSRPIAACRYAARTIFIYPAGSH